MYNVHVCACVVVSVKIITYMYTCTCMFLDSSNISIFINFLSHGAAMCVCVSVIV